MGRQVGRHVVAKLRENAALSCPYAGPYAGRGPRRTEGKTLDDKAMPPAYGQGTSIDEGRETAIDQRALGPKQCAEMLHIGVRVQRHVQPHTRAHVGLCRSDVTLGSAPLLDDARLRVHLAFHVRDAQH